MAGTGLKAIETYWRGNRYRSRLEARWAVFMDAMDIEYRYEPEGFDLDGLWYLPDFWLPKQAIWLEIKPVEPDDGEAEKAHRLAQASQRPVLILWGDIPNLSPRALAQSAYLYDAWQHAETGEWERGWDCCYWWTECTTCRTVGLVFSGYADRLPCSCEHAYSVDGEETPRLLTAYSLARQERFTSRLH